MATKEKVTAKTAVTIRDYVVENLKGYGRVVVPKGSIVTNVTACGPDDAYHYWKDFTELAAEVSGFKDSLLRHDLTYYGLNIPAEYCEPWPGEIKGYITRQKGSFRDSNRNVTLKSKNLWHKPQQDQTYGPEYYTYYVGNCVYHDGCWSVFENGWSQYDFVYRGHTVTQRAGFSSRGRIIERINDRSIEDDSLERVREYVDKVDDLIESECVNG